MQRRVLERASGEAVAVSRWDDVSRLPDRDLQSRIWGATYVNWSTSESVDTRQMSCECPEEPQREYASRAESRASGGGQRMGDEGRVDTPRTQRDGRGWPSLQASPHYALLSRHHRVGRLRDEGNYCHLYSTTRIYLQE